MWMARGGKSLLRCFVRHDKNVSANCPWAACRAELNAVLVASIGWRAQTNELSLSRSLSTGSLEPVSLHHWTPVAPVRHRQAVQVSGAPLLPKPPDAHLRSRYARARAWRAAADRPVHPPRGLHPV